MRKVQFFLLIESMIFTMAAFDVVANEASRTLLLFSALLLVIWYFLGRKSQQCFTGQLLISIIFGLCFKSLLHYWDYATSRVHAD